MADYPEFFLPDDGLYDDVFKISLFEIFDKLVPKNEEELRKYLDTKGYYGRYKLYSLLKKGRRINTYKIEIYLPNSKMVYNWPVLTHFKFDNLSSVYSFYKKFPKCLVKVFQIGAKTINVQPYFIIQYGIEAEGKDIVRSIDLLHQIGLFYDNTCLITDPKDVHEISENLIKIRIY